MTIQNIILIQEDLSRREKLIEALTSKTRRIQGCSTAEACLHLPESEEDQVVFWCAIDPESYDASMVKKLVQRNDFAAVLLEFNVPALDQSKSAFTDGAADVLMGDAEPASIELALQRLENRERMLLGRTEQLEKRLNEVEETLREKTRHYENQNFSLGSANVKLLAMKEEVEEKNLQLQQTDELLRVIVELAPTPFIVSRFADGQVLFANEPLAELVGISSDEMVGSFTPDFYADPADRRRVLSALESEGFVKNLEVKVRTRHQGDIWMIFSLVMTVLSGDKVIIGAFFNIDARRKSEEALRESEERFRQLIDNIQEIFWIGDVETMTPIFVSPAFERIYGVKRADVVGDFAKIMNLIHPEDRERVAEAFSQGAIHGYQMEYRIVRPDGDVRWIREKAFPVYNAEGEVYRVCGISNDVTASKEAEVALQRSYGELELRVAERTSELADLNATLSQSEQRMRALINAIPDMIFRVSRDGRYIDYRAPKDSDMALPAEDVIGKKVVDVLPPDQAEKAMELITETLASSEPQSYEYILMHDDHVHHREARLVVSGEDEVLAIIRDITSLKLVEEELRKSRDELENRVAERTAALEETNRDLRETQAYLVQSEKMAALGTLVAGVAHEINTPVGAISSMHNTLLRAIDKLKQIFDAEIEGGIAEHRKLTATFKVAEDANRVIASGSERVNGIVKRLKSFARLDEAELKTADVHAGIEDTLVLIHHEIKHHINLIKEYGQLTPIACYPGKLNQVLLNLLVNAKQAVGEQGTITIKTRQHDGHVYISITDDGVGIAAENLSRIFDPGFTTKGVGVGTGLGLSIVYRIVHEDHHGDIQVESEKGVGTTFTVIIPDNLDEILEKT